MPERKGASTVDLRSWLKGERRGLGGMVPKERRVGKRLANR